MKLKFELIIDTATGEFSFVNTETGEAQVGKRVTRKKSDDNSTPTLILDDNKYFLNNAALDLMDIEPGEKLDIKYEKSGKGFIPVIASDTIWETNGGNKLCKNLSVACRGSKHQELSKYGTTFTLIPHNEKPGRFILDNGNSIEEQENELEDELVNIIKENNIEEPEDKLEDDIQSLIDTTDDVVEVKSSMFKF